MAYTHELSKLSALVAQANVKPHFDKIAEIDQRLAAEREALTRAENRREELTAELVAARAGKIDSDALADEFRAGQIAVKTTRDVLAIQTDIEGVREAIGKLKWAIEDIQSERGNARSGLAQAISLPIAKVEDALIDRIDAGYRELIACYVDATALADAFRAPLVARKMVALREIIVELQRQETGYYRSNHDASPPIVEAIDRHAELIRAADMRPRKSVQILF